MYICIYNIYIYIYILDFTGGLTVQKDRCMDVGAVSLVEKKTSSNGPKSKPNRRQIDPDQPKTSQSGTSGAKSTSQGEQGRPSRPVRASRGDSGTQIGPHSARKSTKIGRKRATLAPRAAKSTSQGDQGRAS